MCGEAHEKFRFQRRSLLLLLMLVYVAMVAASSKEHSQQYKQPCVCYKFPENRIYPYEVVMEFSNQKKNENKNEMEEKEKEIAKLKTMRKCKRL